MLKITNPHATVADKPILNGVVEVIRLAAAGRASRHKPHPNPSPEGEGRSAVEAQKMLGISLEGSVG